MDEVQTRKEIVDLELGKRGWHHNNPSEVIIEFHMEKRFSSKAPISEDDPPYETKNEFADYVLLARDGQTPLAVVEVKRTSKNARVGQRQASTGREGEGGAGLGGADGHGRHLFCVRGDAQLYRARRRGRPR